MRQRANGLCEYCHAAEQWQYVTFTIDHVVPLKRGGNDRLGNLALACFHCNRYKSANQVAVDPITQTSVRLFDPRNQVWAEHFQWSSDGLTIIGLSATGRTTIEALQFNRERILAIRAADLEVGRHPPPGDPIQAT